MIPGSATPFLLAQSAADSDYKIDRSLRFNYTDTPSLTKTFASAGNRRTWTWSGWVKRGVLRAGALFSAYAGSASDSAYFNFEFNGSDKINIGGWWTGYLQTNRVFRDTSAWYHIVLAFDSTQSTQSDRIKLYVNGVQETSFGTANYVSQNAELPISSATYHNVGANASYSNTDGKFDGYLTDVHFIDGKALAPTDFGKFDDNNVWQPKEYTGGYDVTGGTTVAAATGAEPILNTSDDYGKTISSGVRTDSNSSYIVLAAPLNGSNGGTTITDYHHTVKGSGSAKTISIYTGSASGGAVTSTAQDKYYGSSFYAVRGATNNYTASDYIYRDSDSDLDLGTGSFCVEFWYYPTSLTSNSGIFDNRHPSTSWPNDANGFALITTGNGSIFSYSGGNQIINHSSKLTAGQWHHIAYTRDGSTERLFVNGDFFSSTASSSRDYNRQRFYLGTTANNGEGSDAYYSDLRIYKGVAKYTANFTVPDKPAGGLNQFHLKFDDNSSDSALGTDSSGSNNTWTVNNLTAAVSGAGMASVLYTGNASSQSISGVGFQPDLVWLKRRDSAGNHNIQDVVRGASAFLQADYNGAETTSGSRLSSFDSNGFTLTSDNGGNASGGSYVAWCWKAGGAASINSDGSITSTVSANNTYGFSICTYTGTEGGTFGHGLNSAPKFVIVKRRNSAADWCVWHTSIANTQYLMLNKTDAAQTFNVWGNTTPTSSVVTVSGDSYTGNNNDTYVAYCWSEISGYSKFGSVSAGSDPVVTTGFKPQFVLLKRTDSAGNWNIFDTARGSGTTQIWLEANSSGAENNHVNGQFVFRDDGFQIIGSDIDVGTVAYAAFAEAPDASAIDSLIDTPTDIENSSGNNASNYATLNPLDKHSEFTTSNGNLDVVTSGSSWRSIRGTIGISSGKYYWEFTTGHNRVTVGISTSQQAVLDGYVGDTSQGWSYFYSGDKYNASSNSSYGASYAAGDTIGIAFDADAGNIYFYKNGSVQNSGTAAYTGLTSGPYFPTFSFRDSGATHSVNFGQRPFAHTPPSGYKSLCTANLSDPTIADPSTVFDAKLWTGDGNSTRSISNYSFSPDFVWIKNRTTAGWQHVLYDQIRGAGTSSVTKSLSTNDTRAEASGNDTNHGYLSGFTSNGFDLTKGSQSSGDYVNHNNWEYVGWAWDAGSSTSSNTDGSTTSSVRANPSAGFSIVSWSGHGSGSATVGHGLNAAPKLIILKGRSNAGAWVVGTDSIGWGNRLELNTTSASSSASADFNSTAPTSSVFTVGSNQVSGDKIAYCFAPVEGYSAFGTYTGNGSTDGPFVYTGFRSRFVLLRETGNANYWFMYDTARNTFNTIDNILWANTTHAEAGIGSGNGSSQNGLQVFSNGFKIPHSLTGTNRSSGTFFYAAFAENPFKTARARQYLLTSYN